MEKGEDIFNMIDKRPKKQGSNTTLREAYQKFHERSSFKGTGEGNPICGHDICALVQKRFRILVPPGTIYSVLYSMERNGLIEGMLIKSVLEKVTP